MKNGIKYICRKVWNTEKKLWWQHLVSYTATNKERIEYGYCLYIFLAYIIIYQLIKCYRTKNIIHHINLINKPPRTLTIYFLSRIAKQYIIIVLFNIRNIQYYAKYSHCGAIYCKCVIVSPPDTFVYLRRAYSLSIFSCWQN